MKILQNPIAVLVLAVVAVALIASQIAWPMIQRSHWMQSAPAAPGITAPVSKPAPQPEPGKATIALDVAVNAMPEARIDAGIAGASAARSAEAPRRDPFQGQLLATNQGKPYPPARELLTYDSFWRQSGSTLAVINNRVIAVGDSILQFRVESIEHDRVWVEGPNGRESVEFGAAPLSPQAGHPSGAPTNFAPSDAPDN
jgi:hypothetical protein